MNAKTVMATALVWTALGVGAARAQNMSPASASLGTSVNLPPAADPLSPPSSLPPGAPTSGPNEVGGAAYGTYGLSSWIRGDKYGCCDHVGNDGPIQSELMVSTGVAIPIGRTGQLQSVLQSGLDVGVDARVQFFDPGMQTAWDIELGLDNVYNHAHAGTPMSLKQTVPQNPNSPVTAPNAAGGFPPVEVFFGQGSVPGVTLQDLNRTYVDIGGGKEWYLWGAANSPGSKLRFGLDGGGRYGTDRAEFHEIPHRTDVIAGLYAGVRLDYECPLAGNFVFQTGVRVQYSYTWGDIMQIQNNSDVQELLVLFTVGIRF
jgi:hypothetical protein